jgi:hypothetical protein
MNCVELFLIVLDMQELLLIVPILEAPRPERWPKQAVVKNKITKFDG